MKQNRLFKTLFVLVLIVFGSIVMQAQNAEPYAALSENNTVLTFYYDNQKEQRNGMSVGPFNYDSERWGGHQEKITSVVFDASFANCISITSTAFWFYECKNMVSIFGIENLKTDNVTDMSWMFADCSGLTSLDVSNFKTDNVWNMNTMFAGCSGLTTLDVRSFNTAKVTNMFQMFSGCSALTSLDLSSFNTANVTDMGFMFSYCTGLTGLDLSNFNTANVADMLQMFIECSGLQSLDLSGFNTKNVKDMSLMFLNCSSLKNLDLSGWNNLNVTNMNSMFFGCTGLISLNASNWNNPKVTNMSMMFDNCSSLTDLDLSGWNNPNVTDMSQMFENCSNLVNLNLSGFTTDNVTNMFWMFMGCSALKFLDLSSFNTSKVTSMGQMFNSCSNLQTIYANIDWNIASVTGGYGVFVGCTSLVGGAGTTYDENHIDYDYARLDEGPNSQKPGYFTERKKWSVIGTLTGGWNTDVYMSTNDGVNYTAKIPYLAIGSYEFKIRANDSWDVNYGLGGEPGGDNITVNVQEKFSTAVINFNTHTHAISYSIDSPVYSVIGSDSQGTGWLKWKDADMTVDNNGIYSATFYSLAADTYKYKIRINHEWEYQYNYGGRCDDTSYPATFTVAENGSTVTVFFNPATELPYVEIPSTSNVEPYALLSESNTVLTFYYDDQKAKRNGMSVGPFIDGFDDRPWYTYRADITKVVFDESFRDCKSIKSTAYWFFNCDNLVTIEGIENLNTNNVTNMSLMFANCMELLNIDLSSFNTSNVTDMSCLFTGCKKLESLDIGNFDTSNVTDMNGMFSGCSLTSIDLSNFKTEKVTDMSGMFGMRTLASNKGGNIVWMGCSNLQSLDISGFNTSNVIEMSNMFSFSKNLTTIYVGGDWSTVAVANGNGMFTYCTNLVGGSGTVFDENHTDYTYARIDGGPNSQTPGYFTAKNAPVVGDAEPYAVLSDNNTVLTFYYDEGKANRNGMDVGPFTYSYDENQQRENISSGWDEQRENITNVVFDPSFANCTTLTSTAYWFYDFKNLVTIEGISYLHTDNVTNMGDMFHSCSSLTSLDVSGFKTDNMTDMRSMFYGCSALTNLDVSNFNTANVTNMSDMFSGCSGLTSLDVSNFNTANVTNMSDMFYRCSNLTSLDVSNFKTDNVTEMQYMFNGCSGLTSLDVSNFKIDNVTSMYWMFSGCSGLTSLDVSNFKTDNVTNMQYMFNGCSGLTSLDVSNFNTEKVTNMSAMFYGCSSLTNLDVSGFNTVNVLSMQSMFSGCSSLTSLDLAAFNTANVTNMSSMFHDCSSLSDLDLSNFKTDNVNNMWGMFTGCSGLTSVDVSHFKTDNVGDMTSMFAGCSGLTSLDVTGFKTDNVIYIGGMFSGCSGLTSIDVTEFKTDNVTNMSSMFYLCSGLTSLDVSHFKTDNVIRMDHMFTGCSGLKNLDVTGFKTDNVTGIMEMFRGCSGLTSLDVSGFNTANVTNMGWMFEGCSNLKSIYAGDGWSTAMVEDGSEMFSGCTNLVGGAGTHYNPDHVDYTYARIDGGPNSQIPGYFTRVGDQPWVDPNVGDAEPYAVLSDNNTVLTFYYDDKKAERNGMSVGPFESAEARGWNNMGWTIQTVVFDASFADCNSITSTAFWFYELVQLQTITGLSYLKTDNVTRMAGMFSGRMTSIDLSNFNTAKVTDMSAMFGGCSSLTSIDLSGFNTENVTDMSGMFAHCNSLTSLDLSNFNTSNVVFMGYMFYGCSGLTSLDLSSFNTANVTNMSGMFQLCENLSHLNLSSFNTANVTDMSAMFVFCFALKDLDLSNFNTSNVTNLYGMFHNCISLTDLDLSSFNTANVTAMYDMFSACYKLTTVYASDRWSTASVTEGKDMFSECTDLVGGAGTHYDPDHTDYTYARIDGGPNSQMPGYFTYKEAPVVSDAEPYAVLSDNNTVLTFYYDTEKEQRNGMSVGPFDTPADVSWKENKETVTTIVFDDSFANCTTLTSTAFWFFEFTNLTAIEGISYLHTDNVTNMRCMFWNCSSLTSLDLSGFKTDNVTVMYGMFLGSSSLKTIFAGNEWSTTEVEKNTEVNSEAMMFVDCTSLVGGAGTHYDAEHIDYTYARIDGGPNSQTPGYFTDKWVFEAKRDSLLNLINMLAVEAAHCEYQLERLISVSGDDPTLKSFDVILQEIFASIEVARKYTIDAVSYDDLIDSERRIIGIAAELANLQDQIAKYNPTPTNAEPYAVWCEGNSTLYFLSSETPLSSGGSYDGQTITSVWSGQTITNSEENPKTEGYRPIAWSALGKKCKRVVVDKSFKDVRPKSTSAWFILDLESFEGMENLNTSEVTSMSYMFVGCDLKNIDLSHLDTRNVKYMQYMFQGCDKLETVNLSNFDTKNVTNMYGMFENCTNIRNIDLSSFETGNVTNMGGMFVACENLMNLDISHFTISDETNTGAIFGRCWSLASIKAGSADLTKLSANELSYISNPNLLVYVDEDRLAPEGVQNVVVNGVAREIVLKDVSGNNNWYCPEPFQAEKIIYTRNFNQQTRIGYSRGWESLALPFAVQTITHQEKGAIAPFGSDASEYHFWLRRLTHSGLQAVQTIEANTPYIISMPNSYEYPERFNLSGQVTFAAENVTVPQTVGVMDESTEFIMAPAFQNMTIQPDIYALNVGEKREYYAAGSVFERNYRDVRPFEAYTMHKGTSPAPMYFIIGENTDDNTTDILEVRSQAEDGNGEWYDLQGRKLGSTLNVQRSTLKKGVYILNGRKTVVR